MMKKIQTLITVVAVMAFPIVFGATAFAEHVQTIDGGGGSSSSSSDNSNSSSGSNSSSNNKTTAILDPSWQIEDILNLILGTLTVGASILATGSIIFAGFLYMSAGGNSGQVQRAKTMIFNTVIGIIAYVFMWTLLEWLIPGGVF